MTGVQTCALPISFQAVRDREAAMVFLSSNQLTEILSGAPEDMEIQLIKDRKSVV